MASISYSNEEAHFLMGISDKIIRVIEFASRLCYDANEKMTPTSWEKYIGARVKSGHESVIEHGLISVIIDFKFSCDSEVIEIEDSIAKSNTLLHFVNEYGWNPSSYRSRQIIISGNLKMWRDFFKYIIRERHITNSLSIILNMFLIFDEHSHRIFTKDIPELNISDSIISSRYLFYKENLYLNLGKKWDERELLDESKMELIYRQNNIDYNESTGELVEVSEDFDTGIEYYCASCDNFIRDLTLSTNVSKNLPDYLIAFIQYHTLDINSVSIFVKMPRIVTQQESRHRINSISQRSQRYVDESVGDMKYYIPPTIDKNQIFKVAKGDITLDVTYADMNEWIMAFYNALRVENVPKEDARFILNNGIYSLMMVTKPFYTLPHYFKERCSQAAQKEIREPAIALRNYLNNKFAFTVPSGVNVF